jgi:predicted ATPase/DNA-binding SARP family transcriptional activator
MAKLGISLFGPFQVLLNREPVTQFESAKVRALLAYLAAEYVRSHTRESLAALLWPDWPQQSAMRNLRNALADLRKNIGDREAPSPFLLITRETIQLNPQADVWVDVGEFEAATNKQGTGDRGQGAQVSDLQSSISNLKSAISLYRGPFLDGFSLPDNAPFEEWLLAKREYFSQQMLKALSRLAEWSLEQGEYEQAEGYARRQTELEPWREQAHQQLMRALSLKGERVQALAQFESLRKALQRELKVEPSEDTLQLYQQIREGMLQPRKTEPAVTDEIPARPKVVKPHHNLPLQLTSFIGREKEIDAVQHLLQSYRLVTLTGPGGTGKTRLAQQTAAGLVEQYADGVWLVELAPVSDPALVPTITAHALGLRELTSPQTVALLQEYLEQKQLLLLLDNCEHVIEACARLAETLLQTCPKLTFLASSREALGIAGEVSFRVPPLTFPEIGVLPPLETLAQSEAVRLFVERAATVSSGFALTPVNAPAILQICQRLDGIPLAIELAAARTRLLQVDEIAQRLDDRFRLLTGGSRAALPRYQTLRASIDWSYGLLSEQERALLQRLSVFAGGWALEAAEAVGCGDGIQSCDVLELLGMLVDKSLVQASSFAAGLNRYRMLETIRQYAHEKLVESGQAEAARDRHLQYYLDLAKEVEWKVRGPDMRRIMERLEAELDNLRQALAWSLEGKSRPGWDPEPGLRLATALQWFWQLSSRFDESVQWLELLLAGEAEQRGAMPLTPERTKLRAEALLLAAASAAYAHEDTKSNKLIAESRELFQSLGAEGRVGYTKAQFWVPQPPLSLEEQIKVAKERLEFFRAEGDWYEMIESLIDLGDRTRACKEYDRAFQYYEEELALAKEKGDQPGIAHSIYALGLTAYGQGKREEGRALVEQSWVMCTETHFEFGRNFSLETLILFDMVEGDYHQAAARAAEYLSDGRRQGNIVSICEGLFHLGELALLQGDAQEAADRFEESLAYARKKGHQHYITDALYHLGLLAWAAVDLEQASRRYTEALNLCRAEGFINPEAQILCELGKVSAARRETTQAQAHFEQALQIMEDYAFTFFLEDRDPVMKTVEAMALLAAAQGRYADTARLLGATEAWHQRFFYTRLPRERQEREECVARLRVAMGEQAFTTAFTEGQAMTQEQAVEYAKGLFPPE